ncbi:MAG: putative repeat protein (TIGR04052 family) [Myxococcota bacterium]|jgi:uncharacterized repeat protein (TIGR04052 family)
MLLLLLACTAKEPFSIPFVAVEGEHPLKCGEPTPTGLRVYDLRLFVHDLKLTADDGTTVPLTLTPGPFQTETVAMLDFEDGCSNGTPQTHTALTGTVPPGVYTALSMVVGVPFVDNHANPAKAEGPLSATSMHWTWTGGYKFLRLDYVREDGRKRVHLGSTGCKGEIGAPEGCLRENRAVVTLPMRPGVPIAFDVAGLTGAGGCMGGDDELDCAPVFEALGMDLVSGKADHGGVVFR